MAGLENSSQEHMNKTSGMDQDIKLHASSSGSTDFRETVGALPESEAQQTTTSLQPQKTSSHIQGTRGKLGLHPTAPVVEEHDASDHSDLWWSRVRLSMKEPFAEFWGVFFMVLFGDGSVAQVLLSTNQKTAPGGDGFGPYQSINW